MEEENVKKISELPEADDIFEGCCMPIVQYDETKKIYYTTLKERLKTDIGDPFSGDYRDLTHKPTIPTKTSELENDSHFLTGNLSDYVKKTDYPTTTKAGVVKKGNGFNVSASGVPEAEVLTSEEYEAASDNEFISKGTLDTVLGDIPSGVPDTYYAAGADYAEVGEWVDGNPNEEDRLYRFVTLKADGRKIAIADSDDQIAGVTTTKAAFVGNAKDYDENDKSKSIMGIIGVVPVKTNDSTIKANDRVMSDDNGYAVKSSNNLGYRVLKVLENGLLEIVVSVNTDMIQRIKTDMDKAESEISDLESLIDTNTSTGTNTLSYDKAKAYKVFNCEYKGNVEQETTSGINLINVLDGFNQVVNGVTITTSNGKIKFSGNCTGTKYVNIPIQEATIENGTYTAYKGSPILPINNNLNIGNIVVGYEANTKIGTISETTINSISIQVVNGTNYNVEFSPMLVKGSYTDTTIPSYEKFSGGNPAPNPDYPQEVQTLKSNREDGKIGVKRVGKNNYQIDKYPLELGGINYISGTNIVDNNATRIKDYMPIDDTKSTLYFYLLNSVSTNKIACIFYDENKVKVEEGKERTPSDNKVSFAIPNSAKYCRFRINNWTNLTPSLSISYSDINSYEPYQERIDYIDLQGNELLSTDKIILRDNHYWLVKNWGKVDLSTINFEKNFTNVGFYRWSTASITNMKYVNDNKELGNAYCECYKKHTGDGMSSVGAKDCFAVDISMFQVSTKEYPKGLLYYELKTPQEIDLGESTLKTISGTNNVEILATLEPTKMMEEYARDLAKELDEIKQALLSTGANI